MLVSEWVAAESTVSLSLLPPWYRVAWMVRVLLCLEGTGGRLSTVMILKLCVCECVFVCECVCAGMCMCMFVHIHVCVSACV